LKWGIGFVQKRPERLAQGELLSVFPPEFGLSPALCADNGGFRRGIFPLQLTGALGASQGVFHRPTPLFCWDMRLLFPVIAIFGAYFIIFFGQRQEEKNLLHGDSARFLLISWDRCNKIKEK